MKKKKKPYRVVFTTRKSFSFIMWLIFFIFLLMSSFIIYLENNEFMKAIVSLILFFVSCSFLFNNKIVLEKYFIRIYFGIFIVNVKYKDIKGLYKTNNHLLSLASSNKRVGIKTNKFETILFDLFVSPMDVDDFIYEVRNRI